MPTDPDPDLLCVNTIRALCMDAIRQANSGHPGVLALSRQALPTFDRSALGAASGVAKDGHVLAEAGDQVLPRSVRARVAIEQAPTTGWDPYVGDGGAIVGMHTFGASASLTQLLTRFGFTPDRVAGVARQSAAGGRDAAVTAPALAGDAGPTGTAGGRQCEAGLVRLAEAGIDTTAIGGTSHVAHPAPGPGRL